MLENWTISKRISSGFAVALVTVIVLSATSFFAVSYLGQMISDFRLSVSKTATTSALVDDLTRARLAAFQFRLTGDPESADRVRSNIAAMTNPEKTAPISAFGPELAAQVDALNVQASAYLSAFAELETVSGELSESMITLLALAEQSDGLVQEIVAAAKASISFEEARIAGEVGQRLALVFRDNTNFLLTGKIADFDSGTARMAEVLTQIDALAKAVQDEDRQKRVSEMRNMLSSYTAMLQQLRWLRSESDAIAMRRLDVIGPEMLAGRGGGRHCLSRIMAFA